MKNVYVIMSSKGFYEDYKVSLLSFSTDKNKAQAHATHLNNLVKQVEDKICEFAHQEAQWLERNPQPKLTLNALPLQSNKDLMTEQTFYQFNQIIEQNQKILKDHHDWCLSKTLFQETWFKQNLTSEQFNLYLNFDENKFWVEEVPSL